MEKLVIARSVVSFDDDDDARRRDFAVAAAAANAASAATTSLSIETSNPLASISSAVRPPLPLNEASTCKTGANAPSSEQFTRASRRRREDEDTPSQTSASTELNSTRALASPSRDIPALAASLAISTRCTTDDDSSDAHTVNPANVKSTSAASRDSTTSKSGGGGGGPLAAAASATTANALSIASNDATSDGVSVTRSGASLTRDLNAARGPPTRKLCISAAAEPLHPSKSGAHAPPPPPPPPPPPEKIGALIATSSNDAVTSCDVPTLSSAHSASFVSSFASSRSESALACSMRSSTSRASIACPPPGDHSIRNAPTSIAAAAAAAVVASARGTITSASLIDTLHGTTLSPTFTAIIARASLSLGASPGSSRTDQSFRK